MFKGEPDVLTVVEAAKLLRLGKNKTYDLIKSGYLHSIKADGTIIVPKVYLIEFLCNENNYQKRDKFLRYTILTLISRPRAKPAEPLRVYSASIPRIHSSTIRKILSKF